MTVHGQLRAGSRGVVRYADTVVLRGSGAPLAPPRAQALHAERMGNGVVRSSIQRGARPDTVTRELGYRAACLQTARTRRAPSGPESAMIPRGVAASLERTGGKSFAVNMQCMRDMRSERYMRACVILSADGLAREKSGQGLDRRFWRSARGGTG